MVTDVAVGGVTGGAAYAVANGTDALYRALTAEAGGGAATGTSGGAVSGGAPSGPSGSTAPGGVGPGAVVEPNLAASRPTEGVPRLTSRTSSEVPFDATKLACIQASLEKQGVDFSYDPRMLSPGAEANYYAPPGGGPGTIVLRPNPSRAAVIEELLHLGQHRSTGFAPDWPADASSLKVYEMKAQIQMLNLQTVNWTQGERTQILNAWDWWRVNF